MKRAFGRRHHARELALKVLFELETDPKDVDLVMQHHVQEDAADDSVARFAERLVRGVTEQQAALDHLIAAASLNWRVEQMAKVDRIILRMASYEITMSREVPVRAAINESIELARTFSGDEAAKFVNGVLGKIAQSEAGANPE